MRPNMPSSMSSGNRCTIARRRSWLGAGRWSFSRSIWDEHAGRVATDVPAAQNRRPHGHKSGTPARLPDRLPVHAVVVFAWGGRSLVLAEICRMDVDAG